MFTRTTISFLAALALPLSLFGQGFPLEPGGGGGGSGTVTSIGVTGSTGLTVGGSPVTTSGTVTLTLDTELGQIAALADPNADSGLFWDDSAGVMTYFTFGSGLTMTGTVLSASSLGDGDKGDITVASSGTAWTIDNAAVTLAKLANLSTATFIGRSTAGTGVPEELSVATAKTMLGLTGTNSGDVTFAGSLDYLTLAGQVITVGAIDLATDTTGQLAGTSVSFSDSESNFAASTVDAAIVELNAVDGSGPNSATSKVDWSQIGNVPTGFADGSDDGGGGGGADPDAIHDNVSGEISLITAKATPVAADITVIEDSAASNAKKKITLSSQEALLEGVMDLQDMQGAVTDAQVPDTITVNTANAGDSATAFFTTGQIERARGGTGSDTSAYGDGLIGSLSGGATADIDTLSELETAIGGTNLIASTEIDTLSELNAVIGDGDLVPQSFTLTVAGTTNEITSSAGAQDLSTNRTWTLSLASTIDLGGKTSFEIPNSATPTVDDFGELAGDSNLWGTSRGAPVFFDGTASVALVGALVSDTPLDGQIPRWNTGGTITWETFSATPGGSDTQLQYNDGGTLNGTAGVTYNDGTGVMTVTELTTTTLNATSFRILDNVDQSHALNIISNENLSADANLNVDLDGASRNLNITGNATLSGTNTGDQTITLTGEVTGTGTGSFATTIADSVAVSSWTLTTPTISGAIVFPDDVRQTFNPGTTNAGFNPGSQAGDPSTPSNGDIWYDSTANTLDARINGATVNLGAGGGGGTTLDAIGDSVASGTILTGAFETNIVGSLDVADNVILTIRNTDADTANNTYNLNLSHYDTNDANVFYLRMAGDDDTTPVVDYLFSQTAFTVGANITVDLDGAASVLVPTLAANTSTTGAASTAYAQAELTAYASDTVTFTNKTLDASATGNILKFTSLPQFTSPLRVDGTGCTIGTTSTTLGYGLGTFSNSADQASNWMEFRIIVPQDWNTAVTPTIKITDLIGADTGARAYVASYLSVAASASATGSPGTAIPVNMSADASGASGDVETSAATTLTGWAPTPGNLLILRIARDGDAATIDASTVNSTVLAVELAYGASQ